MGELKLKAEASINADLTSGLKAFQIEQATIYRLNKPLEGICHILHHLESVSAAQ